MNDKVLTEKEKMLSDRYYIHLDDELTKERDFAEKQLFSFNNTDNKKKQREIISQLFGRMEKDCEVKAPFLCDYGYNIELGERVFINYNCILLDCNKITIGDDTLLAPNVQITTAYHPTNYEDRRQKLESAREVTIGKNVWIGAGAIICPGVTIGDNTTIGAGSVVTKDIPSKVVAVGNPCKVIKHLE